MNVAVAWLRGNAELEWNSPYCWFVIGRRGAGKSAFLECLAEIHLQLNHCILDLFASRSGENLCWLRSQWINDKRILILHDNSAIIECSRDIDFKTVEKLSLKDFERYDIIINSSPLYPNLDAEYNAVNRIIDKLWRRLSWKRVIYVLVREAANLLYSRLKVAETQAQAKAFLSYWLRESRHLGVSLGLDSQRFFAVDVEIRAQTDFLVMKSLGALGLPKDMYYVYRFIQPPFLQNMKPHQFAILTRKGDIGVGVNPLPKWHAKPGENILAKVGLKVVFEEKPFEGEWRGKWKTIGDKEHAEIIRLYIDEELSTNKIAFKLNRSTKSIHDHILKHNRMIDQLGYCPYCRRAKSKHEQIKALKLT